MYPMLDQITRDLWSRLHPVLVCSMPMQHAPPISESPIPLPAMIRFRCEPVPRGYVLRYYFYFFLVICSSRSPRAYYYRVHRNPDYWFISIVNDIHNLCWSCAAPKIFLNLDSNLFYLDPLRSTLDSPKGKPEFNSPKLVSPFCLSYMLIIT